MIPTWLWWSSGKDSAWALHTLRQSDTYQPTRLITTINAQAERVAMHGVRRRLLEAQAAAVGLPVTVIELPHPCTNNDYQAAVAPVLDQAVAAGASAMAFGDLFLRDVRDYRVALLANHDLEPVFPIWGLPTAELAHTMCKAGLRARITCLDPKQTPRHIAGADFTPELLRQLPDSVDPCGENGEFHTFAYDGPMFNQPVPVVVGETVERDGFVFTDLLPE